MKFIMSHFYEQNLEFVFTFWRFRLTSSGDIWSQIHSHNVLFRSNELVCNYGNNNK